MSGGGSLKLQKLYLENFRGIDNIVLDLSGSNVVFFGINGVGKSSVLRGVSLLFSNIITKVSESQIRQQLTLVPSDLRIGASELKVFGQFRFDNEEDIRYGFAYRKKTGKKFLKKDVDSFMERFTELYAGENVGAPVFAHYGVNRTVLDIPLRIKTRHDFGKMAAYQNTLGKTDFRTFFEWFRNQEDIENQEKVAQKDLEYKDSALEAVRTAIYTMLPDLSNLRIKRSPLRMCGTKNGQVFSIEQLSDGEKCTLAMVGDIARRLAIANPHLSNPLLGGGIVLIDEVDLHLHPSWQRKIPSILHTTFPNVQFILTTHSPQVLGELRDGFRAFSFSQDDRELTVREIAPGYYDSNLVLEDQMNTPKINPIVDSLESQVLDLVMEGDIEQAESALSQLSDLTNGTSSVITEAQMLIYRARNKISGGVK